MKYYTPEFLAMDDKERFVELWKAYKAHYDQTLPQLPPALQEFFSGVNLHDAELFVCRWVPGETVEMDIGAHIAPEEAREYRRVQMRYEGVVSFERFEVDPSQRDEVERVSEILYNEVETLGAGLFQHRLLFDDHAEVHITFRRFAYEIGDEP